LWSPSLAPEKHAGNEKRPEREKKEGKKVFETEKQGRNRAVSSLGWEGEGKKSLYDSVLNGHVEVRWNGGGRNAISARNGGRLKNALRETPLVFKGGHLTSHLGK